MRLSQSSAAVVLVALLSTPVSAVAQSAPSADPAAEAVARPLSPGAVTRRVNSDLDVSALTAIGEWSYEPALVNGTAVPTIMLVTVAFSLN